MKRTIMIVEPKVHRRLSLVAALGQEFSVIPLSSLDGALRQIRNHRPHIVLIGLGRRPGPGLRLCRQVKTDAGAQSFVGLIDWSHRLDQPEDTINESGCDGIFDGTPSDQQTKAFAAALNQAKPTVHGNDRPSGFFRFFK